MTAHGGSIESLLDEATAELYKLEFTPLACTIEVWLRCAVRHGLCSGSGAVCRVPNKDAMLSESCMLLVTI